MAIIKTRKISWKASVDTNLVSYIVYCSIGDQVNYDSSYVTVPANQLTYTLPGAFNMNTESNYTLAVTAVDSTGNESDLSVPVTSFFDFTAPQAPTEVTVD